MTLALRLGRTVGELLDSMTAAEFLLWKAYDAQSPLSDHRGDVQAALVASSVFQSQGGKVTLLDVLPDWDGSRRDTTAEPGSFEAFAQAMAKAGQSA